MKQPKRKHSNCAYCLPHKDFNNLWHCNKHHKFIEKTDNGKCGDHNYSISDCSCKEVYEMRVS